MPCRARPRRVWPGHSRRSSCFLQCAVDGGADPVDASARVGPGCGVVGGQGECPPAFVHEIMVSFANWEQVDHVGQPACSVQNRTWWIRQSSSPTLQSGWAHVRCIAASDPPPTQRSTQRPSCCRGQQVRRPVLGWHHPRSGDHRVRRASAACRRRGRMVQHRSLGHDRCHRPRHHVADFVCRCRLAHIEDHRPSDSVLGPLGGLDHGDHRRHVVAG